ncbi:MAG: recombinase family protein [Bryobacteraceae bacterium]|nr:recombinase family protein [Bryobacteraceae bacterium]
MTTKRNFETGTTVAIYSRVSTDIQVQNDSLITQEKVLRDYCRSHELRIYEHYSDAGLSGGSTQNRPAFKRMMADAAAQKFSAVVVTKLDRISRNLRDLLRLIDALEANGVSFISISQSFDTSTSIGRLMLNMLGSFAQFEREMIAERVRDHMLVRAREGKWNGGVIPFGYREQDGKLLIQEDEARWVRKMFDLYLEHRSIRHIALYLNAKGSRPRYAKAWSPNSVSRALMNPAYYGASTYNKRKGTSTTSTPRPEKEWIIVEGALPAIVDKGIWTKVHQMLTHQGGLHHRNKRSTYLLSGLIKCGRCGGSMAGYNHPKEGVGGGAWSYYRCSWRQNKGTTVCSGMTIDRRRTEQKIVEAIGKWAADPGHVIDKALELVTNRDAIREHLDDQTRSLYSRVDEVQNLLKRIMDAFQDGVIEREEAAARARPLRSEKQILEQEIDRLEKEAGIDAYRSQVDVETLRRTFAQFGDVFDELHIGEQKTLLASVVKKVIALPEGRLDIHLHFDVLRRMFGASGSMPEIPKDGDLVVVVNMSEEVHMIKDFSEMKNFGERLQWLRKKNRFNKKELARNLGLTPCTISNWELRGRVPHEHQIVRRVAEFFGVRVADLVGIEPVPLHTTPKWRLRVVRRCIGMSQAEMGKMFGMTEEQYHWLEFEGKKGTRLSEEDFAALLERIPAKHRPAFSGLLCS